MEATPRLGSPIVYSQSELNSSPWSGFMKAIAEGKNFDLIWKKGYGIVVLLAVPPFPYVSKLDKVSMKGMGIYLENISDEDHKHIFFEGVAKRDLIDRSQYYISDGEGYVLYVTGVDDTVDHARKKVYDIINKIYIPKMFYRSDIGVRFIERDRKLLKNWGYL